MDVFVSFLTGLDRVKNVHLHSGLGPIGIATAQEVDDFPVVGDGVSGQICSLFVIFDFQINRLINDLHQLHGKLVMGGSGQGIVKILFGAGAVFPGGDHFFNPNAVFVNALKLFFRPTKGGVIGDGRLDDQTDLHHFTGVALHGAETPNIRAGGVDPGRSHISTPAAADLNKAAGAENSDGFPQRDPADAQKLGQLHFVGQLIAFLKALFLQNHIGNPVGGLFC